MGKGNKSHVYKHETRSRYLFRVCNVNVAPIGVVESYNAMISVFFIQIYENIENMLNINLQKHWKTNYHGLT